MIDYSELSISEMARVIKGDWKKIYFGAVPYLDAMGTLNSVDDNYYLNSGKSIVLCFLANSNTWRGEIAREVKKELKKRIK
jgi:hypothetical protein